MADALELLDRAPVTRDRLGEVAAVELHDAEVDQAAADFLDASRALGELEPLAQRGGCFVQSAGNSVGVPGDAHRRGEPAFIAAPLEHLAGTSRVSDRIVWSLLDDLGPGQLKQYVADNRRVFPRHLETGLENFDR